VPSSLERLYAWLIAPLEPHLRTPFVGIIPHGVLHYAPFAAFTDGQRYFGDEHTIFYLPSASVLPFIQQNRKVNDNDRDLLILAYGQAAGFPTLHHADEEARAVAEVYNTRAIVGSAATESTFATLAGDYNILHIAAHGELNEVSPAFSRIVLAPDEEADGFLEVHEVYGLDLENADLVVLSACQTQIGKLSAGDDIVGLNRAFLYAGTPTIIASLWSVDDEATALLMERFYTYLRGGMGKAEALRQAQIDVRAKYPHPYYWAAFALTGDPGVMTDVSTEPATEVSPGSTPTPIDRDSHSEMCPAAMLSLAVVVLAYMSWCRRAFHCGRCLWYKTSLDIITESQPTP
jgi:CHAT domain-containing protein